MEPLMEKLLYWVRTSGDSTRKRIHEGGDCYLPEGGAHMMLNRVDALVHPENTRSLTLLKGIGFVREGTLRQAGFWRNAHHDLTQLSLLRSDSYLL